MNFNYRRWNNIIGWLMFAIASFVYLATMQRTVSWWDCGEFISATYKMLVPHPPGNPTFQLVGQIFTLFAGSDTTKVALTINTMSALCSGFTILFLFWSITMLGRRIVEKSNSITDGGYWAVLGAGVIGSLVYTFTDTFWFSAVEGEVYAMSSFFTAIVFWAMLKWEREVDQPRSSRWLILIFLLIGLAIGVHLLNLLTVPAMAYIFYYKKFDRKDWKGWFVTTIVGMGIVAILMYFIIPGTVSLAGKFELFFVNTCRLPFNTGIIVFFMLLIGAIAFGIWWTQKRLKVVWNTVLLCFTFLLIGYSTFFMVVIRANETLPINMNEPKDAISFVAYLNREQYGAMPPLVYGHYYNSPIRIDYKNLRFDVKEGAPIYYKDKELKRYVFVGTGNPEPRYESDFCTIFPRMYSNGSDERQKQRHVGAYKEWGKIKGRNIPYNDPVSGERKTINKPTFGENLRFFCSYQVGHMYWRYFMWNFSGRQNDIQGHGSPLEGNWITGIDFLDKNRVGSTHYTTRDEDGILVLKPMPESMNNIARNTYYLLPFILGLLGLVYHIYSDSRGAWIVFLLFFMTGLAIVIFLNQAPYQPRERDYAYAGSFYAFCVWIGFSVMAAVEGLKKYANEKTLTAVVTILFLGVPLLMAQQNWDDHDRSKNRAAHDYGANYLLSSPPNAILYSNGDNDTYPLWYAQEVEGTRTDVRVVNYQLSNGAWYANQMAHKINDSERLPLTLSTKQYRKGTNDVIRVNSKINIEVSAKEIIDFINNPKNAQIIETQGIPTRKFYIPIDKDKLLLAGLITEAEAELVKDRISIQIPTSKNYIYKHELLLLDLLATNNWERPICFTSPSIIYDFLPIEKYFHLIGNVYQLLPYESDMTSNIFRENGVRIDTAYHFFMNKFLSGDLEKPYVNIDGESMSSSQFPQTHFLLLAEALHKSGDTVRTIQVADRYCELFPRNRFSTASYIPAFMADCYLAVGEREKGEALLRELFNAKKEELEYLASQRHLRNRIEQPIRAALSDISLIGQIAQTNRLSELLLEASDFVSLFYARE